MGGNLYYGWAIEHTILPTLNEISSEKSMPTEKTKEKAQQLMDYVHTHPNAYIWYYAVVLSYSLIVMQYT